VNLYRFLDASCLFIAFFKDESTNSKYLNQRIHYAVLRCLCLNTIFITGLVELESAGLHGELRIKGVETGFYVTMTKKGRVVGQPFPDDLSTIWIETKLATSTAYLSFLSLDQAHKGWYLAIKKSGKLKAGNKTNHPYPQKAISFLSRIVAEEFY